MTFFSFNLAHAPAQPARLLAPWLLGSHFLRAHCTLYDLGSAVCVPVLAVVDGRVCTGGTETTECGLYQEASGLRATRYRLQAVESTRQSLEPRSQRPLSRVLFLAHSLTGAPQTWKVVHCGVIFAPLHRVLSGLRTACFRGSSVGMVLRHTSLVCVADRCGETGSQREVRICAGRRGKWHPRAGSCHGKPQRSVRPVGYRPHATAMYPAGHIALGIRDTCTTVVTCCCRSPNVRSSLSSAAGRPCSSQLVIQCPVSGSVRLTVSAVTACFQCTVWGRVSPGPIQDMCPEKRTHARSAHARSYTFVS